MSLRSLGVCQGRQRQPIVSNNEPHQDNECEREQACDDDVEIVFVNWIVNYGLLYWSRDDD
jgi:hypothetical protein